MDRDVFQGLERSGGHSLGLQDFARIVGGTWDGSDMTELIKCHDFTRRSRAIDPFYGLGKCKAGRKRLEVVKRHGLAN